MKKMARGMVVGSALLVAGTLQAGLIWSNDFSGASLDSNLSTATQGAGANVTQTGGQLKLDTAVTTGSARAQVYTQKDSSGGTTFNGNPLYDFYNHQVSVSFNIASIAGTPGTGRNVFFVSIGEDASNFLTPVNSAMDYGQGIVIEQLSTGWRMNGNSLNNGTATSKFLYTLSAAPTAVTYTFNGTNATISMTGATFTSGGAGVSGQSSTSVTFDDLSGVAAFDQFNLGFGAYNQGTVTAKTLVTLDSFTAEVIPEPATLGLFMVSGVSVLLVRRALTR